MSHHHEHHEHHHHHYARVGKPAPEFEATAVVGQDFKTVKLSDYKGNLSFPFSVLFFPFGVYDVTRCTESLHTLGKYVVLFFYPLDFTFVCPTEILAFSDRAEEFRKIDT